MRDYDVSRGGGGNTDENGNFSNNNNSTNTSNNSRRLPGPSRLGMDMVELIPRQATILGADYHQPHFNQAQPEYPQSRPASPIIRHYQNLHGRSNVASQNQSILPSPLLHRLPPPLFFTRSTNQNEARVFSPSESSNQRGPSVSTNPFLYDCQSPLIDGDGDDDMAMIVDGERVIDQESFFGSTPRFQAPPMNQQMQQPSMNQQQPSHSMNHPSHAMNQHMQLPATLHPGSLLSDHLEEEKDSQAGYQWLNFSIVDADGGQMDEGHGIDRILEDDESVYCSRLSRNVNILLRSSIPGIPEAHPTFTLSKVIIKIPTAARYTAPLRDGFLFVLSEPLDPCMFSQFDDYDGSGLVERTRRTSNSNNNNNGNGYGNSNGNGYDNGNGNVNQPPRNTPPSLPQVPSSVLAVLYFQLDQKTPVFAYQFRWPIRKASYVMIKMLGSYGTGENIDVQFVGFKGTLNQIKFPSVGLR